LKVFPEDKGHHPSDPDRGHAKFTNYSFDPGEFVRIVEAASEHVRSRPDFARLDKSQTVRRHKEL
jgi:EGF domain-specific O-GlcNAc transferase